MKFKITFPDRIFRIELPNLEQANLWANNKAKEIAINNHSMLPATPTVEDITDWTQRKKVIMNSQLKASEISDAIRRDSESDAISPQQFHLAYIRK